MDKPNWTGKAHRALTLHRGLQATEESREGKRTPISCPVLNTHMQVTLALYELNRLYLRIKGQARQCTQLQSQRCGEQTEGNFCNLPAAVLALNSINDPVSGNRVLRNRTDDSASPSSLTRACVHITSMQYIPHHTDTLVQNDRQKEWGEKEEERKEEEMA